MFSEEKYSDFAKEFIAGNDLCNQETFPRDVWEKMGERELFADFSPDSLNGENFRFSEIASSSYSLTKNGNCIGFVLSFLIHEIISGFVLRRFAKPSMSGMIKGVSKGEVISFAVSEPEGGAHPKFLKTRAVKDGSEYILNGEKAYLTNGPVADHFVVIAVTGDTDSKKEFTAFYVSKDNEGLKNTPPMDLPFFRPSPHGGIILSDCRVSEDNVLGTVGNAWDELVLPFNIIENSLMTAVVSGAIEKQLELLSSYVKREDLNDELLSDLGELKSISETLLVLSSEMAKHPDNYGFYKEHFSLLVFFRKTSSSFQKKAEDFVGKMNLKPCNTYNNIKNDLTGSAKIGANIVRIRKRKLGESLFFQS